MLAASSIENALNVSVRTLPKLPVLYKTNAIASSFGASNIATMTGTVAAQQRYCLYQEDVELYRDLLLMQLAVMSHHPLP